MIDVKNKRKLEHAGKIYYWYVKLHDNYPQVHIISEDKKLQLRCDPMDTEVPVTPEYVVYLIAKHLKQAH